MAARERPIASTRGVGQSSVAFRGPARRPRRVSSTGAMLVRLRNPHANRFWLKVPRIFWIARFTPSEPRGSKSDAVGVEFVHLMKLKTEGAVYGRRTAIAAL